MNKPHIHAEVIKAWADGAEIQYQRVTQSYKWIDYTPENIPQWNNSAINFRIKPEKKSLGQIAYEIDSNKDLIGWKDLTTRSQEFWESLAQAVIKAATAEE